MVMVETVIHVVAMAVVAMAAIMVVVEATGMVVVAKGEVCEIVLA